MDAAQTIRDAVTRVAAWRAQAQTEPALGAALRDVKRFQAQRFSGTYADLRTQGAYRDATRFFLEELYSDKDFTQRDAQFARIAEGLQTFFPDSVVDMATTLAHLHVLTEDLDFRMAQAWLAETGAQDPASLRYLRAWRRVGQPDERRTQLDRVLAIGLDLDQLTRKRGLRLMLKLMRGPAVVAGLDSLQTFLEAGFDTFAAMSADTATARMFLEIVQKRESQWIDTLFGANEADCAARLQACLERA